MVISILSDLSIAIGVVALMIGALGLLRLPDVYCRIHAVGMIDTVGAGFVILGMLFHEGFSLVTFKLLLIGIFLFFTSPIATHAVAQVAFKSGLEPVGRNLTGAAISVKSNEKSDKKVVSPESSKSTVNKSRGQS